MEPVRIKYYGLFSLTRSGYLISTLIAASIAIVAFVMAYPSGLLPAFRWPWDPVPAPRMTGMAGWLYNHFYELMMFLLLMEALDIVVTLRLFARKEAEQRDLAGRGSAPPVS